MNKLRVGLFALTVAIVLGTSGSVGFGCFMRSPQPVQVWLDHINVEIRDQVAVKTYNCTFKNPNAQAVVGGECFMELEPGAQVDDMTVTVDGQKMKAEILDVEKANEVFTEIVKERRQPGPIGVLRQPVDHNQGPPHRAQRHGDREADLHHGPQEKRRPGPVADAQHQPQGLDAAAEKRLGHGQDQKQRSPQKHLLSDP